MSKRRTLAAADEETPIDLSPMIDCIFILLIFFIVTTVFVEEKGFQATKPDAAAATPLEDKDRLALEITADDEIFVDHEQIAAADVGRVVRRRLRDPEMPVVVRAHEHASHGMFVAVWDAARRGGAKELSFSTYQ